MRQNMHRTSGNDDSASSDILADTVPEIDAATKQSNFGESVPYITQSSPPLFANPWPGNFLFLGYRHKSLHCKG